MALGITRLRARPVRLLAAALVLSLTAACASSPRASIEYVPPDLPDNQIAVNGAVYKSAAERREAERVELEDRARQGDAESQYQLGRFLAPDIFLAPDKESGWKWYCLAANRGHREAQFTLGILFEWGYGPVQMDLVRAYVWYALAEGSPSAARHRDQIAANMTPEQIAEAEQLAAEWKPDPSACEAETTSTS